MTFKIKATKKTKEVMAKLPKEALRHKQSIKQANNTIGQLFVDENIRVLSNGARTGRVYRYRGGVHQASAPGEPAASMSGRLARSAEYATHGWQSMSLGQTAKHAIYLDRGTRNKDGSNRMLPRPNVLLSINNISGKAVAVYYETFKRVIK